MSAGESSATSGASTGSGEHDATSPRSPSSPHAGRRRRAVAFSYSRVRDSGMRRGANKHSSSSPTASGGSADVSGAVVNGTNGHHSTHSLSEDGTCSTANTSSSVESGGGGGAGSSGEREGSREEGEGLDGGAVIGYEFVEGIPTGCCCGLCGKLVEDPQQTQCCKTDYCRPCIAPSTPPPSLPQERTILRWRTKPSGIACPDCKTPNVKLKPNKELQKRIVSLQVKCLYASAGCVWEGEREWLREHLETDGGCVYALVVCSSCGDELRKKEEWNHATLECRMRMCLCQYCGREDTHEAVTSHYNVCPQYPTPCPANCGETLPRDQLQYHLDYSCAAKGLKCPFRAFGCSEGLLSAERMAGHVTECGALHLGNMARKVTADMDRMQKEIRELRSENEALRREVQSTTVAMETTNETLCCLRSRSDGLSETLLREIEYYCSAREPHEMVAVECMKTLLASGGHIHLCAGNSPAVIRMTSYLCHKESGQVWLSPPFYVCSGYKLRLAVHLNGVGAGKGSHVSIFLHQMAGERDDQLQWPFLLKDRVRVSLLDQTRTQPHSSTSYTPATPTVQSSPKFPRCQSHLSPSSPSLAVSLPPSASPLRQPRKLADDTRPPPLRQGPALVGVETQAMAVPGFLRRVRGDEMSLGGVPVSKMELFCTQSKVNGVVFLDSLVLSVSLCSGNLISPVSS